MLCEWNFLSDEMQLVLAREAFRQALATITDHAGALAGAIEAGTIADRGGPEALRLFVAVLAETHSDCSPPMCHA
jgi:hypothetical protein